MSDQSGITTPESVFLTSWALMLQAIRSRGKVEALALLDAIEAEKAHVSMHIELSGRVCHILATVCQAGQVDPLVRVSLDLTPTHGRATH